MPVLIRAAHVSDVPPGKNLLVKIRGRKVLLANSGGAIRGIDPRDTAGGAVYRVEVRGDQIWVATDADREAAPARLQAFPKRPGDVPPGS